MNKVSKARFAAITLMTIAAISITCWAMAQRGDTKSDEKARLQGRGWAGQTDQRLLDQLAADGVMQMNKSQIELANFAPEALSK